MCDNFEKKSDLGTPRLNEQLGWAYDAANNLLRRTNNAIELDTPTIGRTMPTEICLAEIKRRSSFSTDEPSESSAYIELNIPQLARLGLFSRSTQGRGLAELFHSSAPGSLAVRDATAATMRISGWTGAGFAVNSFAQGR